MSDYYQVAATLPEPAYDPDDDDDPAPVPPPRSTKRKPNNNEPGELPPKIAPIENDDDAAIPEGRVQPSAPPPPPYYAEEAPSYEHQPRKPVPIKPSLRQRCQKCERVLRRLLPLILLFFYTLLGGIIFHHVETQSQSESDVAKGHRVLIDQPAAIQLEKRMTEIVVDQNYTTDRRKHEVREVLLWYLRLWSKEEMDRWDFPSSLFYSMTLYTTIGYGDNPPKTTGGKILTVIYSVIGIPLCLAALIELGYLVGWILSKLWSCLRHGCSAICGRGRRPGRGGGRTRSGDWQALPSDSNDTNGTNNKLNDEAAQEAQDDVDLLSFPLSVLIILTFVWILLTAAVFYDCETDGHNWSYAESLYFTFISFTTIGLGDYVPGTLCGKLGGIIFLLIGLSILSTTIAVLQQQLEALQNEMKRSIDQEYKDSQCGEAGGEAMATDEDQVDDGLKKMAAKLPPGSRFLFTLMPEGNKKNLKKYYKKKASRVSKSMQTDDYLWAMTTMSKSYLKKVIDEKGPGAGAGAGGGGGGAVRYSTYSDDGKSRDDINSLVAMCDYSLPYDYHNIPK